MLQKHVSRFILSILVVFTLIAVNLNAQSRLDTIRERIENRTFPSVASAWALADNIRFLNKSKAQSLPDTYITYGLGSFHWYHTDDALHQGGDLEETKRTHDRLRRLNPSQILLLDVHMRDAFHTSMRRFRNVSVDFPYWVRDRNGNPVVGWPGTYLLDFTHTEIQNRIVQQVIEMEETGLYDGVFLDWWNEHGVVLKSYRTFEEEQEARYNILRRIREAVHPDFLIVVNLNERRTRYSDWINGSFMETYYRQPDDMFQSPAWISKIENTLYWVDNNLREPRSNVLQTGISNVKYKTPEGQRWRRFFTTMNLIHSNGSVLFAHTNHNYDWHPFWDVDIGKPVSPKSQQVEGQGRFGCFIREFDNGWAIYNRSRKTQVIELPSVATAISTGKPDYIHEVAPMDGEIFVKSHPTRVNPRNLLTTSWARLKTVFPR